MKIAKKHQYLQIQSKMFSELNTRYKHKICLDFGIENEFLGIFHSFLEEYIHNKILVPSLS